MSVANVSRTRSTSKAKEKPNRGCLSPASASLVAASVPQPSEFPSCPLTPLFSSITLQDGGAEDAGFGAPPAGGAASVSARSPSCATPSGLASAVTDGLLFLGTGVSCALPQLGHVLPMAEPSHPFHPFLHLPIDRLPSSDVLHRLAATHAEKECRRQESSGDSAREACSSRSAKEAENPNASCGAQATCGPPSSFPGTQGHCEIGASQKEDSGAAVACVSCFMSWRDARDANHRNNVSAALRIGGKTILIDCGKTFREAALAYFPPNQISTLDAVLLTHDHQDAVGGIDDLRDLQHFTRPALVNPGSLMPDAHAVAQREPRGSPSSVCETDGATGSSGSMTPQAAPTECILEAGESARKDGHMRKALGYRPEGLLECFLGTRTLRSLCSKFRYIVETSWQMQRWLMEQPAAVPEGNTVASGRKRRKTDGKKDSAALLIVNNDETNVHEEVVADSLMSLDCASAPVLERKVACLAFHLLNDVAPSDASLSNCAKSPRRPATENEEGAPQAAQGGPTDFSGAAPAAEKRNGGSREATAASGAPLPSGDKHIAASSSASEKSKKRAPDDLEAMWERLPKPVADDAGFSTIRISGVPVAIYSFPVYHGGPYVSLGFLVDGREKLVYISDVTSFPAPVLHRLRHMEGLDTLVVDAIGEKLHNAHFSVQEALALAVNLQPRNVFFVGMSCSLEHGKTNKRLAIWLRRHRELFQQKYGRESRLEKVVLAVDGLFVPMAF
ncbi:hypothetical protein BESB_006100 [Besnoitia besnoiti]|uniref:Metallo-beta-lactamase domain-containing protein n=1 Tax=Besnoitia besnoiti TaxID=94643 RepID=A0A2A9MK21_BESBE|nr:hypothetical protein BESB_006100 [Besnoitia besnoiti]PFH38269.1 hypothetical protein BESB_006100 [Besnoitia besnoiti]